MGAIESRSVRIYNQTDFPILYVLRMPSPYYWGVIEPGQRVVRDTGRVWFTVTVEAYDGKGDVTYNDVLRVDMSIITIVNPDFDSPGMELMIALMDSRRKNLPWPGGSPPWYWERADGINGTQIVTRHGHYANGDWLNVHGGPKSGQPASQWRPLTLSVSFVSSHHVSLNSHLLTAVMRSSMCLVLYAYLSR